MGICRNCIHIGDKYIEYDLEDYLCLNNKNSITDFITGKKINTKCSMNNSYGECLHYHPVIPFENIKKIKDGLYEITFDYLYKDYYKGLSINSDITPLSSSICNGNFFGYNLDDVYSTFSTVLLKIPHKQNRLASISIARISNSMLTDLINGENLELSKCIPFMAVSGINEAGLAVSINYLDYGTSADTVPSKYEKDVVSQSSLIRYILDNFSAAEEAVSFIKKYVTIKCSNNFQVLLSDGDKTYVLSVINNIVSYKECDYITNIDMTNQFDIDEETKLIDKDTVNKYDKGIERYDIITENYENCDSLEGMTDLLHSIMYTNAYKTETSPVWLSEFTGGDLTNQSADGEFSSILASQRLKYQNRSTDPDDPGYGTRQTSASAVYDISGKTLYISINEGSTQTTHSVSITL